MSKSLRYFMLTAIMAIGLLLGTNHTSAQDVYMGNDDDGYQVYIQTETIKQGTRVGYKLITVKGKGVSDGTLHYLDTWEFTYDSSKYVWLYQTLKSRKAFGGPVNVERNALAKEILVYCLNYL